MQFKRSSHSNTSQPPHVNLARLDRWWSCSYLHCFEILLSIFQCLCDHISIIEFHISTCVHIKLHWNRNQYFHVRVKTERENDHHPARWHVFIWRGWGVRQWEDAAMAPSASISIKRLKNQCWVMTAKYSIQGVKYLSHHLLPSRQISRK